MRFVGPDARWMAAALLGISAIAFEAPAGAREQKHHDRAARRVLWHDPGPISALDLSWSDRAEFPRPAPPFTFVKEDMAGSRAKVSVKDAHGRAWKVKLEGDADDTAEAHAEVAAVRLVWALGYFVEKSYFVEGGVIEHLGHLQRAARAVTPDGRFRGARFKERSPDLKSTKQNWSIDKNPFVGTRELSGLKILMTMISNWDLDPANLQVLRARNRDGTTELRYAVTDLGASFGHLEDVRFPHSLLSMYPWTNWNLHDYQEQRFIEGVKDGQLKLHYRGEAGFRTVPLEDARWFAGLVSQLTPQQIRAAFEAAAATPDQVDGFSKRFLEKAQELEAATSR